MSELSDTPPSSFTFVCCIEAGDLEVGTLRLLSSLRRWGGSLADAPFVTVTPRPGPPISPSTRRRIEELGGHHIVHMPKHRQRWQPYFNKWVALSWVRDHSPAEQLCWVDSDLLVVDDLAGLMLAPDVDVAACAPDKNVGTSGPGDPNEDYWLRMGAAVGVDVTTLPWVRTHLDDERIRLYWNSGVFVHRPRSGLLDEWRSVMEALIWAQDPVLAERVWWADQAALGLAVARLRAPWAALPYAFNFGVATYIDNVDDDDGIRSARILHYHDALSAAYWPRFRERLLPVRPEVVEWLDGQPETGQPLTRGQQVERAAYRAARAVRRRMWRANRRITWAQLRAGRHGDG